MAVSLASVSTCLKVWDFESGSIVLKSSLNNPHGASFNCISWNHTNQVVAIGGNERIDLVQANNGTVLSSLPVFDSLSRTDKIRSVTFSSNSRLLSTSFRDTVQIWDLKKRQKKSVFQCGNTVSCLSFLPNGDVLSGDISGNVQFWDTSVKNDPMTMQMYKYNNATNHSSSFLSNTETTCLHLSPCESSLLAVGFSDGVLCNLDCTSLQETRRQRCHYGILTSVAYSPKNARLVATAGSDGRVNLVDTGLSGSAEFSAFIEIPGGKHLTSLSFHEDAIHTAVSTDCGHLYIFDWRNVRQPVVEVDCDSGPINALSFQNPKLGASGLRSSRDSVSSRSAVAHQQQISEREVSTLTVNSQHHSSGPLSAGISTTTVAAAAAAAASLTKNNIAAHQLSTSSRTRDAHSSGPSVVSRDSQNQASPPAEKSRREQSSAVSTSSAGYASAVDHAQIIVSDPLSPILKTDRVFSGATHSRVTTPSQSIPLFDTFYQRRPDLHRSGDRPVRSSTVTSATKLPHNDQRRLTSHSVEMPGASQPQRPREHPEDVAEEEKSSCTAGPVLSPVDIGGAAVTKEQLEDALQMLRYDIHREVQEVLREQVRQFSLAKDDTVQIVREMSLQLADLLQANQALRDENDRLRRIY